jgi:NAD(P)-dependent dehydrogenase (short-subunit alcohol dehydrogenase family)
MIEGGTRDRFSLRGEVAIVTGGSRGIGRAVSYRLAEAGADVSIVHVGGATPAGLEGSIKKLGRRALVLSRSDVSKASSVKKAVAETVKRLGHIDILVNNAGVYKHSFPEETSDEEWDHILDVNLRGAFLFSREVAKRMIRSGRGGRIVNIASIDAFLPESDFAAYDASKAGLVGLTRSLALAWGKHGINVNAVAPGLVDTGNLWEAAESRAKAFRKNAPLGKVVEPDDVANAVIFLCSAASSRITGQTIVVDSGVSLSGYMSRARGHRQF